MFSQQHYNAIAKLFRENFSYPAAVQVDLIFEFARYFAKDNERFDPIKFLNACSPDADLYPLGELWED